MLIWRITDGKYEFPQIKNSCRYDGKHMTDTAAHKNKSK
jgi:hypothetical protein